MSKSKLEFHVWLYKQNYPEKELVITVRRFNFQYLIDEDVFRSLFFLSIVAVYGLIIIFLGDWLTYGGPYSLANYTLHLLAVAVLLIIGLYILLSIVTFCTGVDATFLEAFECIKDTFSKSEEYNRDYIWFVKHLSHFYITSENENDPEMWQLYYLVKTFALDEFVKIENSEEMTMLISPLLNDIQKKNKANYEKYCQAFDENQEFLAQQRKAEIALALEIYEKNKII